MDFFASQAIVLSTAPSKAPKVHSRFFACLLAPHSPAIWVSTASNIAAL